MKQILNNYTAIDSNIWHLLAAQFCLQLINSAFFLILNLYMHKSGYNDSSIASYMSWRYSAVVFFAIPFGIFIRNRPLLPIIWTTAFLLPILSLFLLWSIEQHTHYGIIISSTLWGVVFNLVGIPIVPYILRHCTPQTQSEIIALNAGVWSAGQIAAGSLIALLSYINPLLFSEKNLLQLFCAAGFFALYFLWNINVQEQSNEDKLAQTTKLRTKYQYNWHLIAQISFPILFIAIGAGMAIPFMNLFFYHIFGMDSAHFSIMGVFTSIIVTISALFAPALKQRLGYRAIIWTQLLSIACLLLIAASEYFHTWNIALVMAIVGYVLRQPLMHLSNPLATEMAMQYVGKNNREITSAITSSIWAGSWFFSSQIFAWFRAADLRYSTIFIITSLLYLLAVGIYALLIRHFDRKQSANLLTDELP